MATVIGLNRGGTGADNSQSSGGVVIQESQGGPLIVAQRLPAVDGSQLTGVMAEPRCVVAQNKDVGLIAAGAPCALHSSGTGIILAASANPDCWAAGLSQGAIAPTFAGAVQGSGLFELEDWTGIIGSPTLAPRAVYYLASAGGLTAEPPTTPGCLLQQIGFAVTPTALEISLGIPILL